MNIRHHKSRGFTLLELVLVLAVLAIIAGMAAPTLRGFVHGRNVPDAAAQLVSLTRWAHTQAIAEGRVYRLNVDPAAGKYWETTEDGTGVQKTGTSLGRTYQVAEGVRSETDMPTDKGTQIIHFYPNGRTEPGTIRVISA